MIFAQDIAAALHGRRSGQGWTAQCPAHEDRHPSFSIAEGVDGKPLVKCFAGCSQAAVVGALRRLNLWPGRPEEQEFTAAEREERRQKVESERRRREAERIERARRILRRTIPAAETLAEVYLQFRGITIPPPTALRFHPRLAYFGMEADSYGRPVPVGFWPALVAEVCGIDGKITGCHTTYLRADGMGKADLPPEYRGHERKMFGHCIGAAIRLAPAADEIAIAEGIESTLSVMQVSGIAGWAGMTAGGVEAMELPPLPLASRLLIFADNDKSGTGQRAAHRAAGKWTNQGRKVRIAMAPEVGTDANDLLRRTAP